MKKIIAAYVKGFFEIKKNGVFLFGFFFFRFGDIDVYVLYKLGMMTS